MRTLLSVQVARQPKWRSSPSHPRPRLEDTLSARGGATKQEYLAMRDHVLSRRTRDHLAATVTRIGALVYHSAVILELQRHRIVLALEQRDDGLQIVAAFAGHANRVALDL